nr:NDxxF motif lipoprotein [Staphylococcus simulans]
MQLYLDSDKKLTKAGNYYEVLSNPEKELTQKDIDKIKKASHLKKENDQNFSNYIQNKKLPNNYQTNADHISQFTQSNNKVMMNLDKSIENSSDKVKNGKLPKEELKALRQFAKSVNGKEQAKIEKFLNQENIHTIAFEK